MQKIKKKKRVKGGEVTREEAIAQLEDLRAHCEGFINEGPAWADDVEALNIAINALKRESSFE